MISADDFVDWKTKAMDKKRSITYELAQGPADHVDISSIGVRALDAIVLADNVLQMEMDAMSLLAQ
jgi:hypothetical protein